VSRQKKTILSVNTTVDYFTDLNNITSRNNGLQYTWKQD